MKNFLKVSIMVLTVPATAVLADPGIRPTPTVTPVVAPAASAPAKPMRAVKRKPKVRCGPTGAATTATAPIAGGSGGP